MLCYSALENSSTDSLPSIIRKPNLSCAPARNLIHSVCAGDLCTSIPAMVIACKSDPEEQLAVLPLAGNDIGAPFGIGLVELSIHMSQGKHKMRMSFGWLLKAISKERSELFTIATHVNVVSNSTLQDNAATQLTELLQAHSVS